MPEAVERKISCPTVLFGQSVELMSEHVQFAGQSNLHDHEFALIDQIAQRRLHVRPAAIDTGECRGMSSVHEQAIESIEVLVARRAVDRPILLQLFIPAQYFFDDDEQRSLQN